MAVKKSLVVKVLGYGDIQHHEVSVATFNELDDFLLCKVDATGCYKVTAAGTREQITPETFSHLLMSLASPIVHVSKVGAGPDPPQQGGLFRPWPPQAVFIGNLQFARDESTGWMPFLRWQLPSDLSTLKHYLVVITEEPRGLPEREVARSEVSPPGGGRQALEHSLVGPLTEITHRAEVHAVGVDDGILESKLVRFVAERLTQPSHSGGWKEGTQKLLPELCSFAQTKKSEGPTFLVVGKQHHGKSSVVNHFNRCLRGNLDVSDVVRAAPPSMFEATGRTHKLKVPLSSAAQGPPVSFLDVPAFAVMDEARKKDLSNLLWNASHDAGRDEAGCLLPNQPDGVIVVVSLLALRGERLAVQEYLHILQDALKRFPYVVAATHKDTFLIEVGNDGQDPLEELRTALQDLRVMANTNQVFAIANYQQRSCWSTATDDASVEMMRQLLSNAIQRTTLGDQSCAVASTALAVGFRCAGLGALLVLFAICAGGRRW